MLVSGSVSVKVGRMPPSFARGIAVVACVALAMPPPPGFAQGAKPGAVAVEASATAFNVEQLDALLAPIALYPDQLLTQMLMASTLPLQIVAATRWLAAGDNKSLKGDALVKALESQDWDPSVKSLIPFPQVLAMLNEHLEWTQQLGYAMANQQAAVLDSIQRLRRQAQKAGNLKTTEQQRVEVKENTVVIEPADPQVVYVPTYQPSAVYGEWPYPATPPVYYPPPPAYYPGYALGAGLAFATGVAITAGLWGWANAGWNNGSVNINAARYNNINVNRAPINSGNWRAGAAGIGGRPARPPGGPVGRPARPSQLPANAIGRSNVQIPGGALNRPQIPGAGRRPGGGQGIAGGQRPGGGQGIAGGQRPGGGQGVGGGQRPNIGQRPSQLPAGARGGGQFQRGQFQGGQRAGAFGGLSDGSRAGQFGARGAQSRNFQHGGFNRGGGGGFQRGGGGFQRGGGGGFQRGGGGGGRGGGRGRR
jgi:hypothetical protein